jgi:hypothetical protein
MASSKQAQPLQAQQVDLFAPIMNTRQGPAPLALRVGCRNGNSISEGVPNGQVRVETYVLLSALPEELRRRVDLAVQALLAGR